MNPGLCMLWRNEYMVAANVKCNTQIVSDYWILTWFAPHATFAELIQMCLALYVRGYVTRAAFEKMMALERTWPRLKSIILTRSPEAKYLIPKSLKIVSKFTGYGLVCELGEYCIMLFSYWITSNILPLSDHPITITMQLKLVYK